MKLSRILQLAALLLICLVSYLIFSGGSGDGDSTPDSNYSGPTP